MVEKINEISGENLRMCMQCGTCSAICPMGEAMPITPRRGMMLLQYGEIEAVQEAAIGTFCASCHTCEVRCPRGISVAKVYEAVRLLALRDNINLIEPEAIPKETLAEAPQIAFVSGFRKLTA